MITGIGTDIVEVQRFIPWLSNEILLKRFFHPYEVAYIKETNCAQRAAARFAAKEAFVKAVGTGFKGLTLRDICTVNDEFGKPSIMLYNEAKDVFEKTGASTIHVTLSHEKKYACAFVVLESL